MISHQNIGMYRALCLFGVFTQPLKKELVVLISIETSLTIVSTLNDVHDCMDAGGRAMQEQLPSEIRGTGFNTAPDFATLYPGYGPHRRENESRFSLGRVFSLSCLFLQMNPDP